MRIGILFIFMALSSGAIADPPPHDVLQEIRFDQRIGIQIPLDIAFQDANGRPVHLKDYFEDRPVLLVPVYYKCPMLCTLTLNGLLRALRALSFTAGDQFDVVVFSINEHETPALALAKKETYVKGYGRPQGEKGWHFLTGGPVAIQQLTQSIGFHYVYDPKSGEYAHATGFVVLTPQGIASRYFYGAEYSAKDMRFAIMEASAKKIGTPVEQILLYCYHYDPATGKYSLAIMRLVRIAGFLFVLLMGAAIYWMSRRGR